MNIARRSRAFLLLGASAAISLSCARSVATGTGSMSAPSPDPRVGLQGGPNAASASWNMRLVSNTPKPAVMRGGTNSDLAFRGNLVFQGNYNGVLIWDASNPANPVLRASYFCPGAQNDVSVVGNLLFASSEGTGGRVDCGAQGVQDSVSAERARGVRIYDISNVAQPRHLTVVQTCRGSHTHTVVTDPNDRDYVYVYVSGSAPVRSPSELPGCVASPDDPNTALFRIEVIRVPVANPTQARIVASPRIFAADDGVFEGLVRPPTHTTPPDPASAGGRGGRGGAAARPPARRLGLTQCHDITVYPAIGRAGGACEGMGLLLDISDVTNPRRLSTYADTNFAYWHSATFSNDGSKVLFTDEWGGGGQPRCRATDRMEWGADAIFTIENNRLVFQNYFKMPAAQTQFENCVAHNGSLVPVPGREIMVQSWYQGGTSVFDWTDPKNPKEIAFFDRGPADMTRMGSGGHWSSYWYNGYIYGSEIARGLDVFELTPSPMLTQNEIDAAKTVRWTEFNPQNQPKIVWPASFVVARAYVDQLARGNGLSSDRIAAIRSELARAEGSTGAARQGVLSLLSTQLQADLQNTPDRRRVQALADVVGQLAR